MRPRTRVLAYAMTLASLAACATDPPVEEDTTADTTAATTGLTSPTEQTTPTGESTDGDEPGTDTGSSGTTGSEPGTSTTGDGESTAAPGACGDGVLDPDEACDDGPLNAFDAACLPSCDVNVCGDSHLFAGVEACDDGDFEPLNACNNFCLPTPTGVDLTPGEATEILGMQSGAVHLDECEVLLGFSGLIDLQLSYAPTVIGGICGALALGVIDGEFAFKVSSTGEQLPYVGGFGDQPWVRLCPEDHVIVGVTGKESGLLTQLEFRCAPLTITAEPDGTYTLARGPAVDLAPVGSDLGSPLPEATCPADQVASGQQIYDDDGMFAALGLTCSVPSLTY